MRVCSGKTRNIAYEETCVRTSLNHSSKIPHKYISFLSPERCRRICFKLFSFVLFIIAIPPPQKFSVFSVVQFLSYFFFSSSGCVAKARAKRQAVSKSFKSQNSLTVWMLFWPAPKVTVGILCFTIQLASNPPSASLNSG